jgi:hypothetical protein
MNENFETPTLGSGLGKNSSGRERFPVPQGSRCFRNCGAAETAQERRLYGEIRTDVSADLAGLSARQTVKTARQKPKNSGRPNFPKICE